MLRKADGDDAEISSSSLSRHTERDSLLNNLTPSARAAYHSFNAQNAQVEMRRGQQVKRPVDDKITDLFARAERMQRKVYWRATSDVRANNEEVLAFSKATECYRTAGDILLRTRDLEVIKYYEKMGEAYEAIGAIKHDDGCLYELCEDPKCFYKKSVLAKYNEAIDLLNNAINIQSSGNTQEIEAIFNTANQLKMEADRTGSSWRQSCGLTTTVIAACCSIM